MAFLAVNILWLLPWAMSAKRFLSLGAISAVAALARWGGWWGCSGQEEVRSSARREQRNRYLRPICAPRKTSQPTYPGNVRNAMLLRGRLDGTM